MKKRLRHLSFFFLLLTTRPGLSSKKKRTLTWNNRQVGFALYSFIPLFLYVPYVYSHVRSYAYAYDYSCVFLFVHLHNLFLFPFLFLSQSLSPIVYLYLCVNPHAYSTPRAHLPSFSVKQTTKIKKHRRD